MQLQPEFPHPLPQLLQETIGVLPLLKPQHGVVGISYDDHIARCFLPPLVHPEIEHIMQVEIGKYRRNHRALWRPFLCLEPPALLHHASL